MQVIGITGGTGCGKTTALNCLRDCFGGAICDCDALYHELLETSDALRAAIRARFPAAFDGETLQRKRLGAVVFGDPAALAELNGITGRFVVDATMQWLQAQRQAGAPVAAIDAIGLMESGIADVCDTTVAILAPTEARVQRLMAREGIPESYARLRISAQPSNEVFTERCAHTIMNDCPSSEAFAARCKAAFSKILKEDNSHE